MHPNYTLQKYHYYAKSTEKILVQINFIFQILRWWNFPNRSHFNSAHIGMNYLKKSGKLHSSFTSGKSTEKTLHCLVSDDSSSFLSQIPDESVEVFLIALNIMEHTYL